jgi:GDP-L-fucose synthase
MTHLPFPTSGIPFYKNRKVSVPGATGLIGSWVVKILRESDARITGWMHKRAPGELTGLCDRLVPGDMSHPDGARYMVKGAEIVVNCVGITGGVGITKVDPVSYVGPATALTCNLIDACHKEGVERMGFLSSTTVYSPTAKPVSEDILGGDPYKLYEGIGYSKRFLEKLCSYYHERVGLKCAVVRPSGAYGRFDNFDESTSHVVPGMIQRALKGVQNWKLKTGDPPDIVTEPDKTFEVWGDGEDVRDLIHAQDVAYGYLLAVAKVDDATPINLASGIGVSTRQLAAAVLGAVGSNAEIVCNPDKPTALRSRLVDIDRAIGRLGFSPRIGLAEGVADTVEWYRAQNKPVEPLTAAWVRGR